MSKTNAHPTAFPEKVKRPSLLSRVFALFAAAPAPKHAAGAASPDSYAFSDHAQEGMAVLRGMRPVFCNFSFAYLLGTSREQLLQSDIISSVHAEDHALFLSALGLSRSGEASSRFLARFTTLPGDLRWGACALRPTTWEGAPATLLFVLDVTDLKKQQQEKEALHAGARAIMDHSSSGMAVFDIFGSLQEANAEWREIWMPEDVPGAHPNVLYDALAFPAELSRAFPEAFAGVEKKLPTLEIPTPSGDMRHLRIGLYPLADDEGKAAGLLMTQEDITEAVRHARTELEHAARSAQARYELLRMRDHIAAVMDATPSVMIGIDEDMLVTLWNSAAERRFEMSRRQTLGRNLLRVCRPLARHEAVILKTVRDRVFSQLNLMPYTEHGRMEYEDITVYPIETNLESGAIIRIDNVTKRVRLENDLAHADRYSAVGMLASGMAHEINNPLSAVLQGIQNLERRLLTDLPVNVATALTQGSTFKAIQDYATERQIPMLLQQMRSSGDRIARIVSNMLQFSRRRDMALAPIRVDVLVREALDLAKADSELMTITDFSQIAVNFDPIGDLPRITCSETEIVQVLLQILRTLVFSMLHRPGPVGRQPALSIDIFLEEEFVAIALRNNGPHLPPEVCKRIFEPFYTTHGMGQSGSGVGLSLALFIITSVHKGSLLCESFPELGTVFTIRLPLTRAD